MTEDRKTMTEREAIAIVRARYPMARIQRDMGMFFHVIDRPTGQSLALFADTACQAWKAAAESLREGSKS